jgi:hypothetical protein
MRKGYQTRVHYFSLGRAVGATRSPLLGFSALGGIFNGFTGPRRCTCRGSRRSRRDRVGFARLGLPSFDDLGRRLRCLWAPLQQHFAGVCFDGSVPFRGVVVLQMGFEHGHGLELQRALEAREIVFEDRLVFRWAQRDFLRLEEHNSTNVIE